MHKDSDHAAEMAARVERRAERQRRSWQLGPTPDRAKERPDSTPPEARQRIANNKRRDDRRRLQRLSNAAATAQGRIWKGNDEH